MSFVVIGATFLFIAFICILFRKASHALDSAQGILDEAKSVTSLIANTIMKPMIKGISLLNGILKFVSFFNPREEGKEKKGGKSGKE